MTKFEEIKHEVKNAAEAKATAVLDTAADHPTVTTALASVLYLAVSCAVGYGAYRWARRDTKKMFAELARETVVNARLI